jgi:hypothetical protein
VSAIPTVLVTRAERDIATSTIVALLEAGVLPRDPKVIARAARVINVPVQDIKHAWTARMTGIERQPQRGNVVNHPRWKAKNPEPDKRVCSRCGLIKSQSDFDVSVTYLPSTWSFSDPCFGSSSMRTTPMQASIASTVVCRVWPARRYSLRRDHSSRLPPCRITRRRRKPLTRALRVKCVAKNQSEAPRSFRRLALLTIRPR